MKRKLVFVFLLCVLIISAAIPVFAAPSPGGLLRGVSPTSVTASYSPNGSGTWATMTDGNENTGTTTTGTGYALYDLVSDKSITGYYLDDNNDNSATLSLLDDNQNVIATLQPTLVNITSSSTGVTSEWTNITYSNVRYARINFTAANDGVLEVDLQGVNNSPPPAPTSLTATPSNGSASLSWTASTGATSYNIYQNGTEIANSITGTTYTATGLTNGTSYSFQVTAVNVSGESAKSNTAVATPTQSATTLSGTAGNAQVTLSWTAVANSDGGYNIYQNGTKIQNTSATTATITGLINGTTYSFTVTSVSGGYESAQSNSVSLTPTLVMPAPPQNITTSGTPGGQGTVSWTVTNPPGQQTYKVYQNGQLLGTTTTTSLMVSNYNPNSPFTVTATYNSQSVSTTGGGGVVQPSSNQWGFGASDVFSNSINLISSIGGMLLLVLVLIFSPNLYRFIKRSILKKDSQGRSRVQQSYKYNGLDWKDRYTGSYEPRDKSLQTGSFLERSIKDINPDWMDKK